MNHATLCGTLTREPKLRYTPSGLAILELQLAGTDNVLGDDGQPRELAWYQRAKVFGAQAEALQELVVGDGVFVPGRLNHDTWESQDGEKRESVDVIAEGFVEHIGRPDTTEDSKGQPRMRASTNRVCVKGNLTRDAELRYTTNGHAVLNLGIAVNDRFKKRDGEQAERVHFLSVTAWRDLAETHAELTKGQAVIIEGRLSNESWEKDGKRRYRTKIEASSVRAVQKIGQAPKRPDIDEEPVDESALPF